MVMVFLVRRVIMLVVIVRRVVMVMVFLARLGVMVVMFLAFGVTVVVFLALSPVVVVFLVTVFLIGNRGDLNAKVKDNLRPASASPRRELLLKVGSISLVHLVVIFNIREPNGDVDEVVERIPVFFEDATDIFHGLMSPQPRPTP